MTRSLLVLAKIFSSGAVLLQNRPFLTPGLQPPDDTMARRSALRSSTHQKVWEIGYQPGFGHTRAAKGTIPLLVTGSKEKTPWETVPWQTWKRDLDNYSLVWCLSAKQQNYSPPAHSCSNGLFFFFLEVLNLEDLNQRMSLADARERKHKLNQMAFIRPCKSCCCNSDAQSRSPAATHGSSAPVPTTASSCTKYYAFL